MIKKKVHLHVSFINLQIEFWGLEFINTGLFIYKINKW